MLHYLLWSQICWCQENLEFSCLRKVIKALRKKLSFVPQLLAAKIFIGNITQEEQIAFSSIVKGGIFITKSGFH